MGTGFGADSWASLLASGGVFDLIPAGFAVVSDDGRCKQANRTWRTLMAIHPDCRVDGERLSSALPTAAAALLEDGVRSARVAAGAVARQTELRLSTGPRLLNLTFFPGPEPESACWVTDATPSREAERQDDLFRRLFHEAPIGAAVIGHDGRWHQVNAALADTIGAPEEALLGELGPRAVHAEDKATLTRTVQAARAAMRASCGVRLLRRNGEVVRSEAHVARVPNGHAEPYFIVHFREKPDLAPARPKGRPVVVIVDDEPSSAKVTGEMLSREPVTVVVTTSAVEALKRVTSDPAVELLVTDLLMPSMTGEELVRRARAVRPNLSIVYVSGFTPRLPASPHPDARSVWLPKPFDSQQIIGTVRALLDLEARDPRPHASRGA
jgi:PAS domain S-box-containing protein